MQKITNSNRTYTKEQVYFTTDVVEMIFIKMLDDEKIKKNL